jgi:hypothetical protein
MSVSQLVPAARTGRGTAAGRRSREPARRWRRVEFTLTDAEFADLETAASLAGLSRGAYAAQDCAFESICETCTFFQTSIAFRPTLAAQRDDAIARHQDHRGQLFSSLLTRLGQDAS